MAYKNSSENDQNRLRRNALINSEASGTEDVTTDEKRNTLLRRMRQLETRIAESRCKFEKKRMGIQKFEIQDELRSLKKYSTAQPGLQKFILDICKEVLPVAQWNWIIVEASRRAECAVRDL